MLPGLGGAGGAHEVAPLCDGVVGGQEQRPHGSGRHKGDEVVVEGLVGMLAVKRLGSLAAEPELLLLEDGEALELDELHTVRASVLSASRASAGHETAVRSNEAVSFVEERAPA